MLYRTTLLAASLMSMSALYAGSDTMQVPEGKLHNHAALYGDITPSAGPRVINGYGVYLTGDYIYWTARLEELDFAVSGVNINNSTTSNANVLPHQKGNKYAPEFRFQSGFKAGIGFNFGHDKWDMYFNYTWLYTGKNHKSVGRKGSEPLSNLIPVASISENYGLLQSSRMNYYLHFNVIDGNLGRSLYISKFLALRPFFGFKGTWQSQKFNLEYDFVSSTDILSRNKSFFWGVGPMLGMNTTWHLAGTWSIFADAAASSLWGDFSVSRKDKNPSTQEIFYNVEEGFHTVKPVVELAIGLRKESWIYNDRFHVALQLGWEQQVWFNQNQFDFYTDSRQGNLNIQGVTAKFRFDF